MQIPYFALRHHKILRKDHRRNTNGGALKKSTDLRFLNQAQETSRTPENIPCLYEAQISIAVTGRDDWLWSAWAFIDTFFTESKSACHYDDLTQGGARPDPLMRGLYLFHEDCDRDARTYFLKACSIWVEQIVGEWHSIVQFVRGAIEQQ